METPLFTRPEDFNAIREKVRERRDKYLKQETLDKIANQLRGLLIEKELERREMETTTLETGKTVGHHERDDCAGEPCVIHNPISGPWSDWPRTYSGFTGFIYRICPHGVVHPCVEDAVRIVKTIRDKEDVVNKLAHACCNECMCLPRTGLPEAVFSGAEIRLPDAVPLPVADVAVQEVESERNPNLYIANWLNKNGRQVGHLPLLMWLNNDVTDQHKITYVDLHSGYFEYECDNDCEGSFRRTRSGEWNSHSSWAGHYCPVMSLALALGYEPQDWNLDGEEDED